MMTEVEKLDNLIDGLQLWYENNLAKTFTDVNPTTLKDTSLVYLRMRTLWDLLKAIEKLNNQNYERIEGKVVEQMENAGLSSYTLANIGRIGTSTKVFASFKDGKKDEGFQWLRSTGNEALITEAVNYQSFSAFVRAEMEANREVPEDLVNTFLKTSVSFTKAK